MACKNKTNILKTEKRVIAVSREDFREHYSAADTHTWMENVV